MALYLNRLVAAADSQFLTILLRLEFRGDPLSSIDLQAPMTKHVFFSGLHAIIRDLTNNSDLWSIGNVRNFIGQSVRLGFPRARVLVSKRFVSLDPTKDRPAAGHSIA